MTIEEQLREMNKKCHNTIFELSNERDTLKAELAQVCKNCNRLNDERNELKERIGKLRDVIQWAIGPTREVKRNGLIAALTEDEKHDA